MEKLISKTSVQRQADEKPIETPVLCQRRIVVEPGAVSNPLGFSTGHPFCGLL